MSKQQKDVDDVNELADNEEDFNEFADNIDDNHLDDDNAADHPDDDNAADHPDDDNADPTPEQQIASLIAQNKDLQHYKSSNEGRVGALQKRVDELSHTISVSEEDKGDEGDDNDDNDEKWNEFLKEDEYIAENVENKVKRQSDKLKNEVLTEVDRRLQPIHERELQAYIEYQKQVLTEAEPDWQDIVVSDEYAAWLSAQPEKVREMASSNNSDDYKYLIGGFKSSRGDIANESTDQALSIKKERRKRLANSEVVTRRNVKHVTGAPEDFDAAFDYYAKHATDNN